MWRYNRTKGYWQDDKTGQVMHTPPSCFPTDNTTTFEMGDKVVKLEMFDKKDEDVSKKDKKKKDDDSKSCPSHKDAILVLKKKINVWAGSANKTDNMPEGALIMDLANRYGNGLRGDGIQLPPELCSKRLIVDWPDMSKPFLFKSEWQILADWLQTLDVVKQHGLYVACLEGHGRTGTALSILAHYLDEWNDNVDVVRQIRKLYCEKAVETSTQIEYFQSMTGRKTTCQGSNAYNVTSGNDFTSYKPTPCYKTVQGVQADCQHTCSAKTSNHKEHWCDKCKWDWWVTPEGLYEKPGPANKAIDRNAILTPGTHLVKVLNAKGEVATTEEWTGSGAKIAAKSSCWDTSPEAENGSGECEMSSDPHLCGVELNHTGQHVCMICAGTWENQGEVKSGDPVCLAMGGIEEDHKCVCTEPFGHEESVFAVHTCSTCQKFFEEEEGDD